MAEYINVGKVVAVFGVRGEVKVIPLTDFPERFSEKRHYLLSKQNQSKVVEIEDVRFREKGIILKLKGIDTPEDAGEYRNAMLQVPRDDAWPLPEGHYYQFQILGLLVSTEEGVVLGRVTEILETGSNDVYLVKNDQGKEYLLPAIKEVVKEIDLDKGRMLVRPLPGLLEG